MNFVAGVYSSTGRKTINEDSVLLQRLKLRFGELCLAVVADGISSLSEGEIASGYVVERVSKTLFETIIPLLNRGITLKGVIDELEDCFYDTYAKMVEYGEMKQIKLGTTMTVCLMYKRRLLIFHLGDSVAVLVKSKGIKRLTDIHCNEDGSLNRCMGNYVYYKPQVYFGRLRKGTGMLIASDGFYRPIEERLGMFMSKEINSEAIIEKRLKQAGEIVAKEGNGDNASAIYVRCV